MTVLAFTGHRPDKLGGYGDDVSYRLIRLAANIIVDLKPEKVLSGMALGWDQAVAYAAIKLKVPVIAVIPFAGQDSVWPEHSKVRYQNILAKCTDQVIASPGAYSPSKMQIRNEWMVDNCNEVIALWDGTAGGTNNCVKYAERTHVPVSNVWDQWLYLIQCN